MKKEVICTTCNKTFIKLRRLDAKRHFCCSDCHLTFNKVTTINCKHCGDKTKNPKFCSKSCAASHNNVEFPKRQKGYHYKKDSNGNNIKVFKVHTCKVCGVEVAHRRTTCDEHNSTLVDWSNVTIGELRAKRSFQIHSRLRTLARLWYNKSNKSKRCMHCNYDKHYEVCHIKPVNSFKSHELVTTVNSLDNLIALCPNCHWEFDNLRSVEDLNL